MVENIIRCALKKSGSVTIKLLKFLSILLGLAIVVTITTFGTMALVGLHLIKELSPIYAMVLTIMGNVQSISISFFNALILVPWYIKYGFVSIIVLAGSIFLYSIIWCMVKDLEEIDWKSKKAIEYEDTQFVGSLVLVAFITYCILIFLSFNMILSIGISMITVGVSILICIAADEVIGIKLCTVRFVGAYLNYCERKKVSK